MSNQQSGKIPTYRILGNSGLRVFPLSLGTMCFGAKSEWLNNAGVTTTFEEAEKMVLKYISVGGNFIDTANIYQGGESEEWLGKIIEKNNIDRERLVIATKYSLLTVRGEPNSAGNHKKNLFRSVRDSLSRLQMDYIDVLYVHYWDWTLDIEDLMRDLHEIVLSGKVLHIAASDFPAWVVSAGNTYAKAHALTKFTAYQGMYNLTERDMEQEIFPMCKALNIGTVCWSALAQGKLSGTKTRENPNVGKRAFVTMTESDFKIQDEVLAIAKEIGKSPSQVALNWAMHRSTSPLLGSRNLVQLEDCLQAVEFTLSKEQIAKLDAVSKESPKLLFPYSNPMLGRDVQSALVLYSFLVDGPDRTYSIEEQKQ